MARTTLLEEDTEGVRVLRLNRPDRRNAFNEQMYHDLAGALREADETRSVRCVLITGTDDSFSAGQDMAEMNTERDGEPGFEVLLDCISTYRKPIVTAVRGVAIGIGATMLLHTDINFAGGSARFRMPFVPLAVAPEAGSSHLLPVVMGYQRTAEILFTGRWVKADEAKELGLVLDVLDDADVFDHALTLAKTIAKQPPAALRGTKELLRHAHVQAVRDARDREVAAFRERLGTPENTEAIRAFFEKRAPDFSAMD